MRRAPYVARITRNAMLEGLPADHVETYEKRIAAITPERVNRAIRENLDNRPLATIIVAPDAASFTVDCVVKSA
ncbi:hypothetical protein [Rhabdaerophilum sp. SD176]|uniref:hypothetical protein n=1 Tax=Rhabdaerophilum sp. SD176 TaxID=2983548 RepID=UPI0024DF5041|nr:hypothetical protein [Rhabdaerophilum sp. SD176]